MKRRIILSLIALLALQSAWGMPGARTRIELGRHAAAATRSGGDEPLFHPAILEIDADPATLARLEGAGVKILHRRGSLLLALIPTASLGDVMSGPGVRASTLSCTAGRTLDVATAWCGADRVAEAIGSPTPIDGTGVVAGFCDIGFDARHPAFAGRIGRVAHYDEGNGTVSVIDDPDAIAAWHTDTPDDWHATHVGGILAGSCDANAYSGIARGATIVATVSNLSDVGLLAGAEQIIDYARSAGMPAVINMSVGSYLGPHDGTSLFSRYMSMLGRDAVVCLSAGNEGSNNGFLDMRFDGATPVHGVRTVGRDWVYFSLHGYVDLWSDGADPIEVAMGVTDDDTGAVVWQSDFVTPEAGGAALEQPFGAVLEGAWAAASEVSLANGRYNLTVRIDSECPVTSDLGGWARYTPFMLVRAPQGARVRAWADEENIRFLTLRGHQPPTSSMSVSDLTCGDNLVCVGMYTTRSVTPLADGTVATWSRITPGTVNYGSGYGVLDDGRVLPHVCAPGAMIVAPKSGAFQAAHPDDDYSASAQIDGATAYWAANGGTSMSSPFMAGLIATWLQADPTLGIDEVLEIIDGSLATPQADAANPRNGRGWIDPIRAMQAVIARTPGGTVRPVLPLPFTLAGRTLTVAGCDAVTLTAVDGRTAVMRCDAPVDLSHLPAGIYIICGDGWKPAKINLY